MVKLRVKPDKYQSLLIDGMYFYCKEISADEAFGRREVIETAIEGGKYVHTELGQYVPREITFTSVIVYPENKMSKYHEKFREIQNKKCEVVSSVLGMFNAYVTLSPKWEHPGTCEIEIKCKEVTNEPATPKYVDPVDTQKADEEARKKAEAEAVESKSTKVKDKNVKATVSKKTKKKG